MKFEPSLQLKVRTTPGNQESFASKQANHVSTDAATHEYLQALQALAQDEIIEADKVKTTSPKLHYNSDQVPVNLPAIVGCLKWIALRTRPDIAWATSRAASLITHDPDTCFIRVKHICQCLHPTLSYTLRLVPIPPQSKQKLPLQQGENISIVISEMINASCDIEVSSDNAAALRMAQNGSETAWRTRHISVQAYGCIRCPGEESSSHINLLLRWQLIA